MLELPNFGRMTASTLLFKPHDKMLLVTEIMTSKLFFQNTYFLRRTRVANFADIIKIATKLIKTTFESSKKVSRIRNYALKCNLYLYFLI